MESYGAIEGESVLLQDPQFICSRLQAWLSALT